MAFEKLENKIKRINKKIKQGRLSQEVADEISNVMSEIEDLGDEAKSKFKDAVDTMKKSIKKNEVDLKY